MKQLTKLGEAALWYAKGGGIRSPWPVFPLGPGGKKPRIPKKDGGHGFHDATTDPDQIRAWWEKYPQANIGVATGDPSGFIVIDVDVDPEKGIDGRDALQDLENQLGKLPDGPVQLTPRGGTHRLFKNPTSYRVRCNNEGEEGLGTGVDVRGNGGYIAVAPSPRKDQGYKEYQWEVSSEPQKTPLPELPTAWLDYMVERGIAEKLGSDFEQFDQAARQRFQLPQEIKPGTRNDKLYRYACSLQSQGYPDDRLISMVFVANNERCDPPLEDGEVNTIIASAMKYEKGTAMVKMGFASGSSLTRLTQEILTEALVTSGYDVKLNIITGEYETEGQTAAGWEASLDDLVTMAHNALAGSYKGVTTDILQRYITFRARERRYNPVLDLLCETTWDEIDRLPQLYDLMGISDDDLSKTLVHKWLLQTVALLFNDDRDPFGADGCLTLKGKQGVGKTSLMAHLAMRNDWFREGSVIRDYDKDTSRRVVTTWIAELGEVESTLRSDLEALKGFITQGYDRYRLPYGHGDTKSPRHSSLCATCNSDKYLIDTTGNRRWWTVPLSKTISRDELRQLDALQLWAQIYAVVNPLSYGEKQACFRLTETEREALEERNKGYDKPLKGQLEVEDILAQADREGITRTQMTVTEFKAAWPALRLYSTQQISAALKRCGIETEHTRKGATANLPKKVDYYL